MVCALGGFELESVLVRLLALRERPSVSNV
jgi:hypothetical protein